MLREFCDFRRGKCERQCGFGILRVESAKAVQNLGIFRGKCEMLTEPGIFCGENTKCRAGISIFCPERTKIRSGFAILSLAAAKSLYHAFQAAAVPRFTEQDVLANPRTAQTALTAMSFGSSVLQLPSLFHSKIILLILLYWLSRSLGATNESRTAYLSSAT